MNTSEDNYWIIKDLYFQIKDDFYEIENNQPSNEEQLIEKTIDNCEASLELIEKINLKVIKKMYPDNIYTITKNIEKFKEQADYILAAVKKIKKHQKKQRNPLPPEMWPDKERVEWEEQMKQRTEGGLEDTREEFDIMGEGFISLENYKKIKKL
jgi:hypothetical protein